MITGVDVHSEYQAGFDFERAYDVGHRFAIIKASEGATFVPGGLAGFASRARKSRLVVGYYHFLDNTADGYRQAEHFVNTVKRVNGSLTGAILAVDYEGNGAQTAGDQHLKRFLDALRRHVPTRPIVVYSGYGFWAGGPAGDSGALGAFGRNLVAWDARYPDSARHDRPREYHDAVKAWYDRQPRWGKIAPRFWQFTSAGLVAGQYVDVDAFYGTAEALRGIAGMNSADEPPAVEPEPLPEPQHVRAVGDALKSDVEGAIDFGLRMLGAPYGTGWAAGTWPALSPLYAGITRHDFPSWYRVRECVCSGWINVARFEVADLPSVGKRQGDAWPGGTAAIGRHLAFAEGSKPYPPVENTPRGWLVWSPYLGASLPLQGHVGIALGNGKVLECRVPAMSANRTENEGSNALVRGGGRPYTRIIPPSLWLRK